MLLALIQGISVKFWVKTDHSHRNIPKSAVEGLQLLLPGSDSQRGHRPECPSPGECWVFLSLQSLAGMSPLSPCLASLAGSSSSTLGEPEQSLHAGFCPFTTTMGKPGSLLSPLPLVTLGTPTYLPRGSLRCLQSALGSWGRRGSCRGEIPAVSRSRSLLGNPDRESPPRTLL